MGGRSAKRKGGAFELEVAKTFERHGLTARKTPMSGAIPGWEGDVLVNINGRRERVECKRRKAGFGTLTRWLAGNWLLAVRDDHNEALIVMRLDDFAQLIGPQE